MCVFDRSMGGCVGGYLGGRRAEFGRFIGYVCEWRGMDVDLRAGGGIVIERIRWFG